MAECTIYDKLRYIAETKDLIKAAIEAQDVEVLESATFRQYAEYITQIRKVSSVNGMQGDVTITAEDLGALTSIPSEYITETELNEKGYLTAVPDTYATEQWVNEQGFLKEHQDISNLATKSELDAKQDVINDLDSIRSGAAKGATALQSVPSEYITETELNEKGYLTAVPDVYITEDELSSQLADKVSQNGLNEAIEGVRNDIPTNVSELTNDSGYITLNEVPKVDLSGYALKSEIPDISVKQDKLTAGNGISITDNVISLDYEYDLFEVVQSLPTENISDNKVYLLIDSNGSEGNTYVEYLYVNGQWEELGKFKVNIDLSGYATEEWVNSQGFLKEHQDISNLATKAELATKQDVISDLETIRSGAAKGATALQSVPSEYATEQWVNEQGFLKEHQDISNLATKSELATKQDVISDLDTIRSGAALGATALQSVPDTYATEQWVNEQGFLKEHQDISNLATKEELNAKQDTISDLDTIRSGAALGATALQSVPSEYVTETELNNKGYLTSVPDTYATEEWVNSQGFLKEHQDISNLATKSELATKQDVINDLDSIRSGAALGATALQEVPDTYALKTDILSAKTDTRYTDYDVQNPVLSGNTIILQNEVTDSRKYHTLGFDKTVETTEIGDVRKYVYFDREFDSSDRPIIHTNFDNYENIPLDFSNITDDGDVDIIYYDGSFVNFENGTEGAQFHSYITYNKNTKILKAIDNERITSNQFKRSDTSEYIFDTSQMQFDCNQLQDGAYLIWSIYASPGLYYRFNASTSGKLFVGETTTTTQTSRLPQNKNEFFRYENDVKAYILTDKNTTFKTINGQQITGNGNIEISTDVDLSNLATKEELNTKQDAINDLETIRSGAAKGATALQSVPSGYATEQWVNEQGFLKEHQDISNLATKEELSTKQNVITDLDSIRSGAALGATALQEVPSEYVTETELNNKGYLTSVPDTYALKSEIPDITTKQDTLVSGTNIKTVNGKSLLGSGDITIDTNVDLTGYATEQWVNEQGFLKEHQDISNLATKEELNAKQDVINDLDTIRSGAAKGATALQSVPDTYALKSEIPDISTKQDTLVSGTNIKTINGTSLLGSGNIEISTDVDLSNLATKDELNAKQDVITDLDTIRSGAAKGATALQSVPSGYATEHWVNEQGFLKEHQDISNLATKEELNTKQDVISDLDSIRSGAALGATALQSVPSEYATEQWVNEQGFLKEHQDISNLATKAELATKQDVLVSGTNIKTINGTSLLGSGNIVIEASADNVPTLQTNKEGTTNNYIYSSGRSDKYGVISDFYTAISYSADKASIHTDWYYWGNTDEYMVDGSAGWSIDGATTSQAGLMSASDKSKLDGINLSTKQDKLVSGTNIKTINGTSLLGSGDITIEGGSGNVDLTDYYTKTETNELVNPKLSQVTLTQAEYDALQTKENNVLYVISDAEDIKFKTINGAQITGEGNIEVATKSELATKQDTINDLQAIRSGAAKGATALQSVPSGYATEQWVNEQGFLKEHQDISNLATKSELATKQDTLVSGTSIKTVNGTSLLGSGNIEIAKEWIGTQAQYDALSTKDNNTTYYITE